MYHADELRVSSTGYHQRIPHRGIIHDEFDLRFQVPSPTCPRRLPSSSHGISWPNRNGHPWSPSRAWPRNTAVPRLRVLSRKPFPAGVPLHLLVLIKWAGASMDGWSLLSSISNSRLCESWTEDMRVTPYLRFLSEKSWKTRKRLIVVTQVFMDFLTKIP